MSWIKCCWYTLNNISLTYPIVHHFLSFWIYLVVKFPSIFVVFVGVLNFCLTEGPFMHSPTQWEHLEFHLTPPPLLPSEPPPNSDWNLNHVTTEHRRSFFFFCSVFLPASSFAVEANKRYLLKTRTNKIVIASGSAVFFTLSSDSDAQCVPCVKRVLFLFGQGKTGPAGLPGKAVSICFSSAFLC